MPLNQEWMTLAEASEMLGVHPATLRGWADAGEIPMARTPGGHRRFRRSDVQSFLQPRRHGDKVPSLLNQGSVNDALAHIRQDMSHLSLFRQSSLATLSSDERLTFRDAGQRLVHLAVQFVARRNGHEMVLMQAEEIGQSFGEICGRRDFNLTDSVRAFLFFRDAVIDSICPSEQVVGCDDQESVRIHNAMYRFFDTPFYAMLDAYDQTRAAWAQSL